MFLVNDFRIINVYQCFLTLSILSDEKDKEIRHEKNIMLDTMDETNNLQLQLRLYTVQKKMTMWKKDNSLPHQKSRYFLRRFIFTYLIL